MRLVGLLSIVFFIAGAGIGAWWFFAGGDSQAEEPTEASAPAESAPTPAFVDLDPLVVPVIGQGQVLRILTLQATIETEGDENRDLVEARAPQLRDAMLSELHALLSLRHVQQRGTDVELYRRHLLAAARAVVGEAVVKGVIIREIDARGNVQS